MNIKLYYQHIRRGIVAITITTCLNFMPASNAVAQANIKKEWAKMHASKKQALDEFQDARFGMFIHWGLYAIPGGIWNGKRMEEMGVPNVAEWIQLVAKIPRDQYAKLAPQFNPVKFNADAIALLAKNAGMKYIVITTKHHDGFAMYHSKISRFNIADATPFKRDAVAELYRACKKHGLAFGIYYSHNIDWADGADAQYTQTKAINDKKGLVTDPFGANLWDPGKNTFQQYLDAKAIPQVKELLTLFPGIKCIWFDMPGLMKPEQSFRFYKTVYNIQPKAVITQRIGNQMGDYDIPGDNKIPAGNDKFALPWETVGTLNNSWGYKSYDHDWKSPDELLYWLLEIVSKGGNYMLNIGPGPDGAVPDETVKNLNKVGEWTQKYGEAIYGTRRWKVTHEGPSNLTISNTEQRQQEGFKLTLTPADFWFTRKNNVVYAMALKAPANGNVLIKSFNKANITIKSIELPGYGNIKFTQQNDGLHFELPKGKTFAQGYAIKATI